MKDRDEKKETKKKRKEEKEELTGMAAVWDYLKTFLIIFCVVFAMNKLVYINAVIPSESMQNTIMKGDRVLGNRLAYIKDDPERYDIVIFKYPDDPSKIFIKRVIGLPGETVTVKDGKIYIDGKEQTQAVSFCPEEMAGSFGPYEVPEDSYFVRGDNRNNSLAGFGGEGHRRDHHRGERSGERRFRRRLEGDARQRPRPYGRGRGRRRQPRRGGGRGVAALAAAGPQPHFGGEEHPAEHIRLGRRCAHSGRTEEDSRNCGVPLHYRSLYHADQTLFTR